MKNSVKKFLGVMAVVLAAPLFLGGTVACSKDCKGRCEDYNKACGTSTNCTTNCDAATACSKEADTFATCVGTDCACTVDPLAQACADLIAKCQTQYDAYVACITPA